MRQEQAKDATEMDGEPKATSESIQNPKDQEAVESLFKKAPSIANSGLEGAVNVLSDNDNKTRELLIQQATFNNSLLNAVKALESKIDSLNSTIKTQGSAINKLESRVWDSGWFAAKPNQTIENKPHGLKGMPLIGAVWAASDENGKNAFLIDSIYSSGDRSSASYGAWIIDVTDTSFSVSTGTGTASSSYGKRNHYHILGKGKNGGKIETNIFIKVVFLR